MHKEPERQARLKAEREVAEKADQERREAEQVRLAEEREQRQAELRRLAEERKRSEDQRYACFCYRLLRLPASFAQRVLHYLTQFVI